MDLHFKMILREFRGFYVNQLRENHRFVARKSKKGKSFYMTCLKNVLTDLGFHRPSEKLIFYAGALAYPKDARAYMNYLKPVGMS